MSTKALPRCIDTPEKKKLYRMIEERPQQVSLYKQLASLLRAEKHYAGAAAILRKGMRRHPTDSSMASHLAQTHCEAGEASQAIALYQKVIRERPGDPVPYEKIEKICRERGELRRAVKMYQAIKQDNPLKERSYDRIHFLLVEKMRDFTRGAENLRDAIRRFGPSYRRCKDLGRLHAKQGHWKEAARSYAMALELKKDDTDLISLLGWALSECGEFTKAEECFNRVAGTFQGSVSLAELALKQGRLEEAEARLSAISRAYPASPRIAIGLAEIRLKRGDAESARRSCEEALRRVPPYFAFEQAHGHEVLAAACRRLGDHGAARYHRELAAALRKGPDTYTALITLAEGKISSNDLSGAEAVLNRMLELYPGNTRALIGHCELQLRLGDARQAVFFGERALAAANPKYADERIQCHLLLKKAHLLLKERRSAEEHGMLAARLRAGGG
jgi:predicted Zn-dependent protease